VHVFFNSFVVFDRVHGDFCRDVFGHLQRVPKQSPCTLVYFVLVVDLLDRDFASDSGFNGCGRKD
jgi:hypothetical protein